MQRRKFLTMVPFLGLVAIPVKWTKLGLESDNHSHYRDFHDVLEAQRKIDHFCEIYNVTGVLVLCSYAFIDKVIEWVRDERLLLNTVFVSSEMLTYLGPSGVLRSKAGRAAKQGIEFGRAVLVPDNSLTGTEIHFTYWDGLIRSTLNNKQEKKA